jgi:tRNA-splicing ligase RtcB
MYKLIGNIPVWGEHDEATLAQIKRCASDEEVAGAALMADGHKGYSMPIGGVVAYRDAVSPSGVGYDISCLVAGTPVSTNDGYWLPIEHVQSQHPITCWDGDRVRLITPHYGAIARSTQPVVTIRLANGRTITATPDHQIYSGAGWKPAGELSPDDCIACNVFVGLPHAPAGSEIPLILRDEHYAAELQERGLFPLHGDSPLFPVVVRLLGLISGDGHLAADGKRISVYTTNQVDAEAVAHDFEHLGYRATIARRTRDTNRKDELHVYVSSVALHAFYEALGSPVGKQQWPAEPMPWLFALPSWVRAHFLSAFCSAEMMTPRVLKARLPNLQLKQAGEDRHGIDFIGRLFESLGYAVSIAQSDEMRGTHRDYVLQILGGGAAQVRFLEEIGFCYALEKRIRGAEAASAYWQHAAAILQRAAAQSEARKLKAAGVHWKDILSTVASRYEVSTGFVYHAIYDERGTPRLPGKQFSPDTNGEIVWVAVAGVEPTGSAEVYDVVTSDTAQAFFASGTVVHNCGNKAVRIDIRADDLRPSIKKVMDKIARTVVFGIGQTSGKAADHDLFDDPTWRDVPQLGKLKNLAREQLGTVGSGNHFVDIFEDEEGWVWVGAHFGSRGFGHKTASGFLNLSAGRPFDAAAPGEHMDQPATVFSLHSELGQAYWQAMTLAGRYAYAGRDFVVDQVLGILGARATDSVHNHHNYAWIEKHNNEDLIVVRKGATPAWPGQRGFIGGSMGDISVIVEGIASDEASASLHSTIHGAGRVMSRTQAAGRRRWVRKGGKRVQETVKEGKISRAMMLEWVRAAGVELRGAGTDESPHVYRRLNEVLAVHIGSIRVLHTLRPMGVAMAGEDEFDPYKD